MGSHKAICPRSGHKVWSLRCSQVAGPSTRATCARLANVSAWIRGHFCNAKKGGESRSYSDSLLATRGNTAVVLVNEHGRPWDPDTLTEHFRETCVRA